MEDGVQRIFTGRWLMVPHCAPLSLQNAITTKQSLSRAERKYCIIIAKFQKSGVLRETSFKKKHPNFNKGWIRQVFLGSMVPALE